MASVIVTTQEELKAAKELGDFETVRVRPPIRCAAEGGSAATMSLGRLIVDETVELLAQREDQILDRRFRIQNECSMMWESSKYLRLS